MKRYQVLITLTVVAILFIIPSFKTLATATPSFFWQSQGDFVSFITQSHEQYPNFLDQHYEIANNAIEWRFPNSTNPTINFYVQLSSNYDWVSNPISDPEFIHAMYRFRWLVSLSIAEAVSQDPKYLKAIADQINSFCRFINASEESVSNDGKYSSAAYWHPINVALRCFNMIYVERILDGLCGVDDATRAQFYGQLSKDLFALNFYINHAATDSFHLSNQSDCIGEALFFGAVMFPEMSPSGEYLTTAINSLEKSMATQVLNDGMQIESALTYLIASARWLGGSYKLGILNQIVFSDEYSKKLHLMLRAIETLLQPNGFEPALGDSDRDLLGLDYLGFLNMFGETSIFSLPPNPLFMIPATEGDTSKSMPKIRLFPDGGYYTVRNGSLAESSHLAFHLGPMGYGSHAHYDFLSFELYAKGKVIIADPGRWLYDDNDKDRDWVISTMAHNTISINGKNHKGIMTIKDNNIAWIDYSNDRYWHIIARHDGYKQEVGSPVVTRDIKMDLVNGDLDVMDSIDSASPVNALISLNIPFVNVIRDGSFINIFDSDGKFVAKISLIGDISNWVINIYPYWYSPSYAIKQPSTRVEFSSNSASSSINYKIVSRTPDFIMFPVKNRATGKITIIYMED